MYTVLVVEDDKDIINLLTLYLENAGMRVISASNGLEGLEQFAKESVDLALIDIMMPEMDGYELTRRLRDVSNVPIVVLSAKSDDSDKILSLDMGADDYIAKPFNPLEVVARVKSNLRRVYKLSNVKEGTSGTSVSVGELSLDLSTCVLTKNGVNIALTSTEYRIMQLLMQNPGRIFTKVQIYENAIGEYFESDENTIMVHISRLRDKIETDAKNPEYIKTVRGLGYKIEKK